MNVLEITSFAPFALSEEQQKVCSSRCLAYINANDINVTTCGTRIHADNVFPQRNASNVQLIEYKHNPIVEVKAMILTQPIVASVNKQLLQSQNLFAFCQKKQNIYADDHTNIGTIHSDCKHVKLVINAKDIIIAT